MTTLQDTTPITISRSAAPAARYRQPAEGEGFFAGLDESVNRYELLTLVKRAGSAAGFSARMVQLLDYYAAFTRDVDWEEGSRPVCFQSLAKTALALGVSERQIQKLEHRLFEAGAVRWVDSGNHRRYGCRDERTGRLRFAFGIDLSPLKYLREELQQKLAEKQLYEAAWLDTKRRVSWFRAQLRGLLTELEVRGGGVTKFHRRYDEIAVRVRTQLDLAALRRLLEAHTRLHAELLQQVEEGTGERASGGVEKFVHLETTNQPPSDESDTGGPAGVGFREEVAEAPGRRATTGPEEGPVEVRSGPDAGGGDPAELAGLRNVSVGLVLRGAGPAVLERLPVRDRPTGWGEVVEAAHSLARELGVSQRAWGEACGLLGRRGAAVCVVVLDGAMARRPIERPPGYFGAMLRKARRGELRLHASLCGLAEARAEVAASSAGKSSLARQRKDLRE